MSTGLSIMVHSVPDYCNV